MGTDFHFLEITVKTLCGFVVILLLTRMLGKKQLSNVTFFTYVTGITIGSITASMVIEPDTNFFEGLVSLALWAILTVIVEIISLKSSKARVLLDGQPTIVIKKGEILEEALAQCRLNMDDLSMMLRKEDVFSIKDVAYAILEPNGQLSVLKKKGAESVLRDDLHIKKPATNVFPSELIVDSNIVEKNLKEFGLTKEWLFQELEKHGVYSLHEVFYAELQEDGSLLVDKKGNSREYHH
ncbi:DUF421 domain-containing protein [Brevibacillus reuszeri]|uniref:DUF421 domain-containing protein n=1 Tax=Brevibacillus reuszeri TaxID=54915 RepID=UPI0028973EB7|nr:DUF421 domain-containing protein [Brevibacillus reuszeri]